jgi:hypothetical protein
MRDKNSTKRESGKSHDLKADDLIIGSLTPQPTDRVHRLYATGVGPQPKKGRRGASKQEKRAATAALRAWIKGRRVPPTHEQSMDFLKTEFPQSDGLRPIMRAVHAELGLRSKRPK